MWYKLWYLDYENCKCRKRLADKLIDDCTETIEETKLTNITFTENENIYERGSCMVYIVLMIVVIVISTGITVYLVYYNWSLNKNNISCIKFHTRKNTEIWWVHLYKMETTKQINIKNRTYYIYNDFIDLENFDAGILKIDKKSYKDIGIYNIGYVTKKKVDDCININSVNPLYLNITHSNGYIEEKDENECLVFDSIDENKELLKKYNDIFNGIRDKIKGINSNGWLWKRLYEN